MCVFIRIRERERERESTGEKGRKDRCKDRRRVGGRKERIKQGKKECFNKKNHYFQNMIPPHNYKHY